MIRDVEWIDYLINFEGIRKNNTRVMALDQVGLPSLLLTSIWLGTHGFTTQFLIQYHGRKK